ncbi:MFS transporter, MHS family, alpha-ketoglutarate permease [Rosenbergiella nectarea]|uniref:Alpha-ketoglutarate permease n=1 Tax=Rosenbergiella nectarea TaxID=988801 RepID=A0A1H9MIR9_9GAMM|nr:MFS family transporter [Rosenbergiella nectarea]SER23441.1 MFS transporter, MHS family, alpha-ketoglutarate permease [Rosenbergiella nectarea]
MNRQKVTSSISSLSDIQRIKAILGASSGNLVEWFDFYVYSFFSIYFAHIFFPQGDATTQLLQTAGVFAAGFLMRPIGGWLFGYIGDRFGRKKAMLISVYIMCFGSLVIAFLPGYNQIGLFAPILLLVVRMLQGLSVGGEYGASATYMSEIATEGKKGFYSSFHYLTLIGGQLMAVLTVVILQQILDHESLRVWGWRIPFLIGAGLAIVALWLRKSLHETSDENQRTNKNSGSLSYLLRHYWRPFIKVIGISAGGSLTFYTYTTYMQKYLINSVGLDAKTSSMLMTGALLLFMFLQPIAGALSDKIGRKMSMFFFSSGIILFTVPIMVYLTVVNSLTAIFLLISLALMVCSFYTSISGLLKAELFPPQLRALGVGLPYAIGNAIFGGSAEFVALGLKQKGMESSFFWYVTAMGIIVLLISMSLPNKKAVEKL